MKDVHTSLGTLSSFLSNPAEAAMKSDLLLDASYLDCKTTADSSRENKQRTWALIHLSDCSLWDLGLTPITYCEGRGAEGGGHVGAGAKEMTVNPPVCDITFLTFKPLFSPVYRY